MLGSVRDFFNSASNRVPGVKAPFIQPPLGDPASQILIDVPGDSGHTPNEYSSTPKADDSSLCIITRPPLGYPTAAGGLADVYKCTWKSRAGVEEVAVKCFRFKDQGEAESFRADKNINREVEIWGMLEHPYVLSFLGTVEGFGPFRALVSPWMPNGNLSSYLGRTDVTLTEMDKLHLLIKITEGLKYLHDKNVIHGDLTSTNVLIGADGSPRLADFGVSNIMKKSDPEFSYHPGAVRWIAPECLIGPEEQDAEEEQIVYETQTTQYGTRSGDVYALGCIMLQVLYGKEPYWWLKDALHVIALKLRKSKPVKSSIKIQSNHLAFMQLCWSDNSEDRPSLHEVMEFLQVNESLDLHKVSASR